MKNKYLNSIINESKSGLIMVFNSKFARICGISVVAFVGGLFFTAISIITISKINLHKGVGGFETSVVPEYSNEIASLLSETYSENTSEVSVPNSLDSSLVTYQTYRVKQGDMIGYIADDFGVTQDTIISVNNIKQSRLIQVGQYLKIPSMPGIIYTVRENGETPASIAQKYKVDAVKCANANSIEVSAVLNAGTSLFVPDAELDWMTRQEINGDLFHRPLHGRYWLSSAYGWRDSPFNAGKRTFHGGMDMATSIGTPIYAALDGVVSATGYNSVYGNYVIITHHSGYKTLYGHMSQINCKKGNFVYTSTMIGRVGSTGMSTGPHLHFTVYKNGKTMNPALLLN